MYDYLQSVDCLGLLKSPDVIIATTAIVDKGRSRPEVQQAIKTKEAAVKRLVRKFSNDDISEENIEWCLYSIGDNSAFLVFNRDPVDQMIGYLSTHFPQDLPADHPRSLSIRSGYKGARLSYPHSQQYQYCLQTLTLWREIQVKTISCSSLLSLSIILIRMICSNFGVLPRKTCWLPTTITV